jgi:hypothetical protein
VKRKEVAEWYDSLCLWMLWNFWIQDFRDFKVKNVQVLSCWNSVSLVPSSSKSGSVWEISPPYPGKPYHPLCFQQKRKIRTVFVWIELKRQPRVCPLYLQSCMWIVALPDANVMSLNMTGNTENFLDCINNFECQIFVDLRFWIHGNVCGELLGLAFTVTGCSTSCL